MLLWLWLFSARAAEFFGGFVVAGYFIHLSRKKCNIFTKLQAIDQLLIRRINLPKPINSNKLITSFIFGFAILYHGWYWRVKIYLDNISPLFFFRKISWICIKYFKSPGWLPFIDNRVRFRRLQLRLLPTPRFILDLSRIDCGNFDSWG